MDSWTVRDREGSSAITDPSPSELADWLADYTSAASAGANVDAFVAHVDRAILEGLPELAADPVLTDELHASTRAQFRAFLNLLDQEQQEVQLPPQAVDLAQSIARRGMDLDVLLKVYRVAMDQVWTFFSQVADDVPPEGPERVEVLKYLWGRGGRWINGAIEQLIRVYMTEREAALHGTLARRGGTIQAVLRGDRLSLDAASRELGHHLRNHQTALVLWQDTPTGEEPGEAHLDSLAQAIAKALGGARPLTLPPGRRELWAWVATRGAPDLTVLPEALQAHGDRSPGARIAVGRPAPGLDGFRTSHREALDAQRCAVSGGSDAVLTAYEDVELVCLIAGSPDAARLLVERELGDLASPDPTLDKVRETLGLYLRLGCNVEATASELVVHKNTIRYRLGQAEDLVGHPLSERRTEMDLALRYLAHQPRG